MTQRKIGLALSGGGSRAIAFHLGCLRALHQLGILDDVNVLSTVSGGSVIGALYASSRDFPEFEAKTLKLLKSGLVRPAMLKAFTTAEGLRALYCWSLLAITNAVFFAITVVGWAVSFLIPPAYRKDWVIKGLSPPLRRFASRTTILRRLFDEDVFGGRRLRDLPDGNPLLIVNAADLRTGSAFYFSRKNSGSWRLGELASTDTTLGHAVAASAAYPLLLPALDEVLPFNKKDGSRREERVTLTDGGVYDNLGLAPLWPDRDPNVSLNVNDIDTIICCRAGYGLRFDPPSQSFVSRLKSTFACVHDRAQNGAMKRLFDLQESGKLKDILIPYLGQNDKRLKFPPDELVTREEAYAYPTDFSAMTDEWVEKLSRRGEQLTRALVAEHWLDVTESTD